MRDFGGCNDLARGVLGSFDMKTTLDPRIVEWLENEIASLEQDNKIMPSQANRYDLKINDLKAQLKRRLASGV